MVYVWMTLPGVDFDDPGLLAEPMTLASGRRVWVTARIEPVDAIDPEPLPVSAMIEPLWQEEHGVPCPGMLLRGVHLDTVGLAPSPDPTADEGLPWPGLVPYNRRTRQRRLHRWLRQPQIELATKSTQGADPLAASAHAPVRELVRSPRCGR